MESLFGIPIERLMWGLVTFLVLGTGVGSWFAIRNPVFFKIALRNIPRRRAQTSLIVTGLMLATVLFSASLSTGDTLSHSIRLAVVNYLGNVDELISSNLLDKNGQPASFDQSTIDQVVEALSDAPVDGVMPILTTTVAAVAPDGRSEPRVQIDGRDDTVRDAFSTPMGEDNSPLLVKDLGRNQLFISSSAAENLRVGVKDSFSIYLGEIPLAVTVAGIFTGNSSNLAEQSAIMRLSDLQAASGKRNQFNQILISNRGGLLDGAEQTTQVLDALENVMEPLALKADDVKQQGLELADQIGGGLASIFLLFGSFSIIAGILLIFLIFVMLAAERKRELGIARAVGGQRQHIVRLFAFEGAMYSVMAATIGSVIGIVVGLGMVRIMAAALGALDFELEFALRLRTVIIAFSLGMTATFLVVLAASIRVSRLNVVRSIRDLPDLPPERGQLRHLWAAPFHAMVRSGRTGSIKSRDGSGIRFLRWGLIPFRIFSGVLSATTRLAIGLFLAGYLALIIGLLLVQIGVRTEQAGTFLLGGSVLAFGIPSTVKHIGLIKDRVAYTVAGLLLVALWIVDWDFTVIGLPDFQVNFDVFVLSGVMIVIGAVWVVMYNSRLPIKMLTRLFGQGRIFAPIIGTAMAYPLTARFRTGMTLAMFSLVVFVLMVMGFIVGAFSSAFDDTRKFSGGFDIAATVAVTNPISDIQASLQRIPRLDSLQIERVAPIWGLPVKLKQHDPVESSEPEGPVEWFITGVDENYTETIEYGFLLKDSKYPDDESVWRALSEDPSTAIVSTSIVPDRSGFGEPAGDFELQGFYQDAESLPEIYIEIWDFALQQMRKVKIIGIADENAFLINTVLVSNETLQEIPGVPVPPFSYQIRLNDPLEASSVATILEEEFIENGVQAEVLAEIIEQQTRIQVTFNRVIQGFMGLGLIVGVAALGVIAARSVVERRTQIGMLRALGFQKWMVLLSFLIESSFIALLGIIIGMVLGSGISIGIISAIGEDIDGLTWKIPWGTSALVFGIAYGASLLTTYLPAYQASRVYPAQALRFEE